MTDALPDLRNHLATAQEWVATLLERVAADQWVDPTPCAEFDVRALTEHLFALPERLRRIGEAGDVGDAPERITFTEGDVATTFRKASAAAMAPWADDTRLAATITGPWGTSPGGVAIAIYTSEHLTHGWDLARATGQPTEGDPEAATAALNVMQRALPAEPRGGALPFAAVVAPAADAPPTEQLANWLGRASR